MTHPARFRIGYLIFTATVAATVAVTAAVVDRLTNPTPPGEPVPPRVECPSTVDLGECVYGSDKRAEFIIRNAGGGELLLHSFMASCTCSSISRRTADGDMPIDRIALAAGEEARIAVTVTVRSRFNTSTKTRISFQTTDPAAPEVGVEVASSRVIGGLTPLPGTCNFGSVAIGSDCRKIVHLVDEAVAPRKVTAVVSSDPDRIRVFFRPSPDGVMPADVTNRGHYLGSIAIAIDTVGPGSVDGQVVVYYADDIAKSETVPILGTVVAKLAVTPETLTLRLSAGDGPKKYAGTVWLRAQGRFDRATVQVVEPSPAHATADDVEGNFVPVRVSVDPSKLPALGEQKWTIELSAVLDGVRHRVPLTLVVEPR